MLSVGQFAKRAQVSARTLRHYENIGLLPSFRRSNNYRHYDENLLCRMQRIRDLQALGFRLDEIKEIISFAGSELNLRLQRRLNEVDNEIESLNECRERLKNLLSVATKIETGESLTETERTLFMEAIREDIVRSLQLKYPHFAEAELNYLQRDSWFYTHPEMGKFMSALKKCIEFAKNKNLLLGPGRGSAPASITIFGIGFSSIDPLKHEMIPERLTTLPPNIHIDVEFERGQEFVDYCSDISKNLSFGEIQAFRMPLLDILKNVDETLGAPVNYDAIDDDSDLVLEPFRTGEIEKIFNFDFSDNALVMKYENFLPDYSGLKKIKEYLQGQKIHNFRDIINMISLWRPCSVELIERLELYKQAKQDLFKYDFLDAKILKYLESNFGRVIYHEDIISILAHYTEWELGRCNALRRAFFQNQFAQEPDWQEFQKIAPRKVVDFVQEESRWTFCKPHAIAFSQFTKKTAVLKSLHKDVYFAEIQKFEQRHGYTWDDIGIRLKGVSILQS